MEKTLHTLKEFEAEAQAFVRSLRSRASGATLVTLAGELGAGKTAFTKAAALALGVEDTVTSPTFVLEKIYGLPQTGFFRRLVHIDAYRLESGKDLAPLAFEESMKDTGNLIFLEWPERVEGALPPPAVKISIQPLSDNSRKLTYVTQN